MTEQSPPKPQSTLILDLVRVFALLQVLLLHASEIYLKFVVIPPGKNLAALVVMTTITRPAVPLFVMLSGYLHFLPEKSDEPVGPFLLKKLNRLKPALVWVLIYWAYSKYPNLTPLSALYIVIGGNVYFHLRFVYMLFSLYLVTPILRKFSQHASDKLLYYFFGMWLLFSSTFYLKQFFPLRIGLYPFNAFEYVGYYMFGHWLYRFRTTLPERTAAQKKHWMVWLGTAILACVAALSILVYAQVVRERSFNAIHLDPTSPIIILFTTALAALFILLDDRKPLPTLLSSRAAASLKTLSNDSFSIYLAHMLILKTLATFAWVHQIPMALGTLALFALTFLLTTLLIALLHRIPLLKDWL